MAIYKIKLKKEHKDDTTKFIYPKGYDSKVFSPFIYQNEGKTVEYCLAKANSDKVKETPEIKKITKTEAETLIDDFVEKNKDTKLIKDKFKTLSEQKSAIKQKRKLILNE